MPDTPYILEGKLCRLVKFLIKRCDLPLEEVPDPFPVLEFDSDHVFVTMTAWRGYGGYLFFTYNADTTDPYMIVIPPECYSKQYLRFAWHANNLAVTYQGKFDLSEVMKVILKASFGEYLKVSHDYRRREVKLSRGSRNIILVADGKFVKGALDRLKRLVPKVKAKIVYSIV